MIAAILLAWLKLLAVDGDLAKAEPKTLRHRVLHTAARLVRGGRRRRLKIQATWPWAAVITAAWQRIDARPHPAHDDPVPATRKDDMMRGLLSSSHARCVCTFQEREEGSVMAIVGAFDIHRRQVTFDYLDTVSGQVRRGRISSA